MLVSSAEEKNWGMYSMLSQMWGISYGVSHYNFVYSLPGMWFPPCWVCEEGKVSVFNDARSEEETARRDMLD